MQINVTTVRPIAVTISGFNDISVENVSAFMAEAVFDLATRFDSAGVKETTYLYGIDEDWTDLPEMCVTVKRIFKDDVPYDDFVIENGKIKFAQTGEYKAEIISIPIISNTSTETTLNINPLYLYAICYYVAYKETSTIFMHEDMVEGNNKSVLLLEYYKKAEEANSRIGNMKRSRKRIKYAPFM